MRGYLNKSTARLGAANNIVIATTSTSVAVTVSAGIYQVRVAAPAACFVKISDGSVTAAATDALVPANVPEYFIVTPGQKVAAFSATTQTISVNEIVG